MSVKDKARRRFTLNRKFSFRRDGKRVWGNRSWVAKWDGYGPEGRARMAADLQAAHNNEITRVIRVIEIRNGN